MGNNPPHMDNDPKLDSSKGNPLANPTPNKDLENPISQKLLHTPHEHAQHILKKLRREKTTKSQMHPLAGIAKSQT
jgi:hypothetical protein